MFIPFPVEDTRLVEEIDAHLARSVDDLFVAEEDADVGDAAVFVAEEREVAGLCFLEEIDQLATFHLLRRIAREEETSRAGA